MKTGRVEIQLLVSRLLTFLLFQGVAAISHIMYHLIGQRSHGFRCLWERLSGGGVLSCGEGSSSSAVSGHVIWVVS
jgi:hypothetical protein